MKKYKVLVPFCGYLSMVVDAETEGDAIENALNVDVNMHLDSHFDVDVQVGEWDMSAHIERGNVFYGGEVLGLNRAEATEIEDEDE